MHLKDILLDLPEQMESEIYSKENHEDDNAGHYDISSESEGAERFLTFDWS